MTTYQATLGKAFQEYYRLPNEENLITFLQATVPEKDTCENLDELLAAVWISDPNECTAALLVYGASHHCIKPSGAAVAATEEKKEPPLLTGGCFSVEAATLQNPTTEQLLTFIRTHG